MAVFVRTFMQAFTTEERSENYSVSNLSRSLAFRSYILGEFELWHFFVSFNGGYNYLKFLTVTRCISLNLRRCMASCL